MNLLKVGRPPGKRKHLDTDTDPQESKKKRLEKESQGGELLLLYVTKYVHVVSDFKINHILLPKRIYAAVQLEIEVESAKINECLIMSL